MAGSVKGKETKADTAEETDAEAEVTEEATEEQPSMPVTSDGDLSVYMPPPDVQVQRANKKLEKFDFAQFDHIGEVDVEGDTVTVERGTQGESQGVASNIVAVVPGEWEQVASYEFGTDEEPQWRTVIRRKE